MTSNKFIIFVVFCGLFAYTTCQTFQYSRGWTNGKRGAGPLLDQNNQQIRSLVGPDGNQSELKYERLLHHLRQLAILNENQRKNSASDYDLFEPIPLFNEERFKRDAANDQTSQ